MGVAALKAQARAALHGALSEAASYTFAGTTSPNMIELAAGLTLTVRWHNKLKIVGENTQADAGIIEGVNRLVFNTDQLEALGLTLSRLGVIDVPAMSKSFRLDYREESDGPLNEYWSVIEL